MRYPFSAGVTTSPDTLGVLELTSIALGYAAADAMVKKAPITMIDATPASPGKFLILFTGDVASVKEADAAGVRIAGRTLAGRALIFNLSPQVIPAINRLVTASAGDTVGVLETFSAASAVLAADSGAKAANVVLQSVTLLNGLGGKAFVVFTGEVADVEAAMESGTRAVPGDSVADSVVLPTFHPDLFSFLPGGARGIGSRGSGVR